MTFPDLKTGTENDAEAGIKATRISVEKVITGTAIAILSVAIVFKIWSMQGAQGSFQTAPQQSVAKMNGELSMSPHGDSIPVYARKGCAPYYDPYYPDRAFSTHCVYVGGRTGTVGDPVHPCGDGPMLFSFVHDESGLPNKVTYRMVCD